MLMPRIGYPDLKVTFDLTTIEALKEDENNRVSRDVQLVDRGVLTINEVRRSRGLPDVPWGDVWPKEPPPGGTISQNGVQADHFLQPPVTAGPNGSTS